MSDWCVDPKHEPQPRRETIMGSWDTFARHGSCVLQTHLPATVQWELLTLLRDTLSHNLPVVADHAIMPPSLGITASSAHDAGFLLLLTSLLDDLSGYAAVRVLTAPFIWLGTNSLAVFAGDIMLQVSAEATLSDRLNRMVLMLSSPQTLVRFGNIPIWARHSAHSHPDSPSSNTTGMP